MSVCAEPRCPEIVTRGYCPKHARTIAATDHHHHWYHLSRWKHPRHGLRAQVLREEPLCADRGAHPDCTLASTDADHIVPHKGDETLFWSRANLTGRCRPCHARKTRRGE